MDAAEISRHIDLDLIQHSIDLTRFSPGSVPTRRTDVSGANHRLVPPDINPNQTITQFNHSKLSTNPGLVSEINLKANKVQAKRCLTSSYSKQRRHWWKVCWIYNGNLLFDSLSSKYACVQLPNRLPVSNSSPPNTCSTLPRDLKLSSDVPQHCLHMSTKSGGNNTMVTSSHDQHPSPLALPSHHHHHHQSTLPSYPNHRLTESKSMTTLEARPAIFSFPNQLKLVEKNLHKEVSRFCSQQLAPSNFLPNKLTQPLAIWTKSKSDLVRTNVVTFLNQYKGADWRHKQLQYQMPIHDIELFRQPTAESKFIRNKQRKALVKSELFLCQQSNETCPKCKQLIQSGIHAVKITLSDHNAAMRTSKNAFTSSQANPHTQHNDYYHIDCFTCFECDQILVDLKAFINVTSDHQNAVNYNLFCCRHFVEIYKPRCPYCDKLIFDEECTEAEGKAWHIGHFCCTECKRSLGGQQYIMASIDNKHDNTVGINAKHKNKQIPYCLTCFDIMFGELCEECGELIGCEVGAIMHDGRSWHASDSCFRCSLCLKSLLGKPFLPAMDGRIYCSLTCSQAMISHQKERLRRQTKLQTLHSHRNSTPIKTENKIVNQAIHAEQCNKPDNFPLKLNQQLTNNVANKVIKENRDNFMKSMTLGRYEKQAKQNRNLTNNNNDYQKIKSLNLTQIVNYEEFIKQNNQCFTSKYDWSKEQEFLNVIDSSNEVLSQTTISDQNSEDHNLMQQFLAKCDITASDHSERQANKPSQYDLIANSVKPPLINGHIFQRGFQQDLQIKTDKRDQTKLVLNPFVAAQSTSSSQNVANNSDIQLENSIHSNDSSANYYFEEKSSSLNSPSSSNETPLWTTSPPPEYSKIEKDFKDESSSSISSIQNVQNSCPKNINKSSGILKVSTNHISGIKQVLEASLVSSSDSNDNKPIATNFESIDSVNYKPVYNPFMPTVHKTRTNCPQIKNISNGNDTISKSKSVSFDPNIEDRSENKLRSIRKIRSVELNHEDCSDSHSCSSCSTCSSSSSDDDDDDFDYNLTNFSLNAQPGKSQSASQNGHQTNQRTHTNNNNANNEACIIS